MGNKVAATQNGYKRIEHITGHIIVAIDHMDKLSDDFTEDIPMLILTALCADAAALSARLTVFAAQYKEQLECVSIDQ